MPTITLSLADLQKLTKAKLNENQLDQLLAAAKAELENQSDDEIQIHLNDTNQPHLWSAEGLARLFRGLLGKESGIPHLKAKPSNYSVRVDASVNTVRPAIACFVAKGPKMSEELLLQLIQLQEKLAENYGRKREKLSIGLYPSQSIVWPVQYKAVAPDSVRFVPLEFVKPMTLRQIVNQHPKGKEYGHIISSFKRWPILIDHEKKVLSLAPVINSQTTGKLSPGDEELFFDATGTDHKAVELCANIVAHALQDRGYTIYRCTVKGRKSTAHPTARTENMRLNPAMATEMIGIALSAKQFAVALKRMRYDVKGNMVVIPHYRQDIMHPVDLIEDVAIGIGYDKLSPAPLELATRGGALPGKELLDRCRQMLVGLGYQEILSPILSSRDTLYERMAAPDPGTVEIENPMVETYSVVRTWLLPGLVELLSKNKHIDYPQQVFEQGPICQREKNSIMESEHLAFASAHANASFTEARQAVECLMRLLGTTCTFKETDHSSFIRGRVAQVIVSGKPVGMVGELAPEVLFAAKLEQPAAGAELSLSALRGAL